MGGDGHKGGGGRAHDGRVGRAGLQEDGDQAGHSAQVVVGARLERAAVVFQGGRRPGGLLLGEAGLVLRVRLDDPHEHAVLVGQVAAVRVGRGAEPGRLTVSHALSFLLLRVQSLNLSLHVQEF